MRYTNTPIDMNHLRPLAWIMLAGLAGWGLFFWWAPSWAMWILATLLGVGVSVAVGYDFKRMCERKMAADEIRARVELQTEIDEAGGLRPFGSQGPERFTVYTKERPRGDG